MDKVIVLDFGGQYTHLISRRIRDMNVFSEVLPAETTTEEIRKMPGVKGVILSGGAASVYDEGSPKCGDGMLGLGIPVLGICYGHQLIAFLENGKVRPGKSGEYGMTGMEVDGESVLLAGLGRGLGVWMNHGDTVESLPEGYRVVASTAHSPVAAFENPERGIFGVQFHPEVTHTEKGDAVLRNFVLGACKAKAEWTPGAFVERSVVEARKEIGEGREPER